MNLDLQILKELRAHFADLRILKELARISMITCQSILQAVILSMDFCYERPMLLFGRLVCASRHLWTSKISW